MICTAALNRGPHTCRVNFRIASDGCVGRHKEKRCYLYRNLISGETSSERLSSSTVCFEGHLWLKNILVS